MKNKIAKVGEIAWFLGVLLCSLGVCLTVKADFGVATIIAPGYIIYLKISQHLSFFTLGMSQYLVQSIVLVVLAITVRRFKLKYLLCFLTAIIHGVFVDVWSIIFNFLNCNSYLERGICFIIGMLITSLAISLMLRTYLPQEVHELTVKEMAQKFSISVNRFKFIYDSIFLVTAIIAMILLFGKFSFEMVGIGTLMMAILNAPLITMWGKILDKFFAFTPISTKFYDKFEKIMD